MKVIKQQGARPEKTALITKCAEVMENVSPLAIQPLNVQMEWPALMSIADLSAVGMTMIVDLGCIVVMENAYMLENVVVFTAVLINASMDDC